MIKVDFHLHTTCSDGILSPKEVVKRANDNCVKYLSITDHDTLSGIDDAILEGQKYNIKIIPGIELSTQYNNESIHILGFFTDEAYKNNDLIKSLNKIKNHRIIRAKSMVEKLKSEFKIDINFEEILEKSGDTIARPHIARAIIDAWYPYDFEYIFDNFIGKNCKAYVPTLKLDTIDGVNLLKKYNALTFLAHPKLISNSNISEFLNIGLDGIEAIYYQNTTEENDKFVKIATENNLLISCGSDFHGNIHSDSRHGDVGSVYIPNEYLNKLLNALNIDM